MITGSNFARYAQSFDGVRWQHQGRTRHGIDCVGLVIVAARDVGLLDETFDVRGYSRTPQPGQFLPYFKHFCRPILRKEMQVGDLMIFRNKLFPTHVGIVTAVSHDRTSVSFIHSENDIVGTGRVHEQALLSDWDNHCTHVFRFKRLG